MPICIIVLNRLKTRSTSNDALQKRWLKPPMKPLSGRRVSLLAALLSASSVVSGFQSCSRFPLATVRNSPTRESRRDFFDDDPFPGEEESYDGDDAYARRRRARRQAPEPVSGGGISTLLPRSVTTSLLAGVFVLGIGTGVTVDSAINTNPKDLASRDAIDRAAPNSDLCQQYGSSAMVMDQRIFVSFNPFNVYVTQADTKPGCVLRPSNVVPVLQNRGLLERNEIAQCKNNMNTWAFVGDLADRPQLSCVYRSQDAQNEFLSNPKIGLGEDIYDNEYDVDTAKRVKQ